MEDEIKTEEVNEEVLGEVTASEPVAELGETSGTAESIEETA